MNHNNNKSFSDFIFLIFFSITSLFLFIYFDAAELIDDFIKEHEDFELDEIVLFLLVLSLSLFFYSIRRFKELQNIREKLESSFNKKTIEVERIKNKLNIAVEIANLGTWEWEIENDISNWSDISYNIYGVDKNTPISTPFIESLIYKEDLEKYKYNIYRAITKKQSINFEYRILRNNEIRILLVIGNSILENNNVIKIIGIVQDITEIKKSEKQLQKTIAYNKTLIDNFPFLVWLKDKESRFITVNKAFAEATNLNNPENLIGKTDFDIWPEELAKDYVNDDKEVLKSGKSKLVVEEVMDKDKKKYFETFKNPVYDETNNLLGSIGYAMDISDKLETQEKLKNQYDKLELEKKKLHTIIHTLPDLLWIKDKDGVYLACNKRFEDFFGYKEEEIVGKTDYNFVNKELADSFREHDTNAMKSSTPVSNFETLPFNDNHIEHVQTTKTKVELSDGSIYGILGISRDITELKKLEEQLLNTQRIGGFGSYSFDIKNNIWKSSEELNKIFGINEDYEKTIQNWLNIVHNDYKKDMHEYLQNDILTQKQKFDKIYKIIDQKTLEVKWVHGRGELSFNNNGEPIELYGMIQDITFQKQKEDIIQSQKEEFKTIFNYTHDSIVITDLDLNFLNFNNAFIELTGFSKDELLKKNCLDLTAPEDKEKNRQSLQEAIEKGHTNNFEKDCIMNNDKRISVNISISLLPDKNRLLLTLKDISNLKIMEEQTKLASMGEMIGNIAHQWRQPLSIITSNISGLQLRSTIGEINNDDIDKCANDILKQANYLSSTIDNFRNFIKEEKENNLISLKSIIENLLALMKASLKNNYITLILDVEDDMEIFGNKNELVEALINIVSNSKDILKTKKEEDRLLFITTKKIDDNKINLLIYDSAGGIPEDIIEKIFIPYFTTKHQSIGTGLGLSIVDKIIRERYNGTISVYNKEFEYNSKQYKGACFSIVL